MKRFTFLITALLSMNMGFAIPGVHGTDVGSLYDHSTLTYWQSRTPTDLLRYYYKRVLPAINQTPGLSLRGMKRVEAVDIRFPLQLSEQEPWGYQSNPSNSTPFINMSVHSIRFLGDLLLATAWLQYHGTSQEPVAAYVSMLKYQDRQDFSDRQFPQPLNALNIPNHARENPQIDNLYMDMYHTALVFILGHELGHVYWGHESYGDDALQSQKEELQADLFALNIMDTLDLPHIGMVLYFMYAAHWTHNQFDFESREAYESYLRQVTHPLTSARLRVLADYARESQREIRSLANFLDDLDIQEGIAYFGRRATVASLARR